MLHWLYENLGTLLIALVLAAVVTAIVWSLVRKKKQGESSCGCGCAHCAMNGTCHCENDRSAGSL